MLNIVSITNIHIIQYQPQVRDAEQASLPNAPPPSPQSLVSIPTQILKLQV